MKLISLSIIVACTGAVFAIPGGQLNPLEKRDVSTKTLYDLHLVQVIEETSVTLTSTTTFTDVHIKTQTNFETEFEHRPNFSRSILDPWPLIATVATPTVTRGSSTFPWPAVDFTDSSRGHGSSPPWPVVTDITKSKNSEPSAPLASVDVTEITRSRGYGAWPDVEVTHIARSRAYSTDVEYIDIVRSKGRNPFPVATLYEDFDNNSEYEQIWRY